MSACQFASCTTQVTFPPNKSVRTPPVTILRLLHPTPSSCAKRDRQTLRVTIAHCAPSWSELITNMQNLLEHHLISTKLHCALPKCTLVQNYIVNRDLHVRCQPQIYYMSVRLCTICVCLLSIYLEKVEVLGLLSPGGGGFSLYLVYYGCAT